MTDDRVLETKLKPVVNGLDFARRGCIEADKAHPLVDTHCIEHVAYVEDDRSIWISLEKLVCDMSNEAFAKATFSVCLKGREKRAM